MLQKNQQKLDLYWIDSFLSKFDCFFFQDSSWSFFTKSHLLVMRFLQQPFNKIRSLPKNVKMQTDFDNSVLYKLCVMNCVEDLIAEVE